MEWWTGHEGKLMEGSFRAMTTALRIVENGLPPFNRSRDCAERHIWGRQVNWSRSTEWQGRRRSRSRSRGRSRRRKTRRRREARGAAMQAK